MKKLLSWSGMGLMVFGFLYMTWHMGRAYETSRADEMTITSCEAIEDSIDCSELRMEVEDFKRIYEEVLREVNTPGSKDYWNGKYREYAMRDTGGR